MNTNEYNALQNKVLKFLKDNYRKSMKYILQDIDTISLTSKMCNKQLLPLSSLNYQVKTIKHKNNDKLCFIVKVYQDIIFPELSFNNDINNIVSSPTNLSIWLIRYLCYSICQDDFYDKLEEKLPGNSITEQYRYLDSILFNLAISKKILLS